jgi:peptidoglycan/xylan/chitin deacetylase (PgdA/CDA1 family)
VTGGSVPILMYHEVSPSPHPAFRRYTVTPRAFARQMRWLAAFGYRPIDMDTLVRARQLRGSLPKHPVVITFDDGLQGAVDHALPVLQRHRFTAVFYLVAGLMGQTTRWLRAELGIELPIISWDTARRLAESGFQCGAHTLTHPRLAQLSPAQHRPELVEARDRLEQELSRPVAHLAYPFGSFDPRVREAAADAGYISACSTQQGLSNRDDDLLTLHRVPVYGHETLVDFAWRLRTARALSGRLSASLRDLSRRIARPMYR